MKLAVCKAGENTMASNTTGADLRRAFMRTGVERSLRSGLSALLAYRTRPLRQRTGALSKQKLAVLFLLLCPTFMKAADLKSETLQAWDAYIRRAQVRMQERSRGQAPFLRVDESPELLERVRIGGIFVEPEGGESPRVVPSGLIHDWVGAVFVPNATLDEVTGVLNEYQRYVDFYRPMVAESGLLEQGPNRNLVRLLMTQKAYSVTAAVETDDEVHVVRLGGDRAYRLSTSIHVQEIADYGKASEHVLPQDHGPGYIWRTCTVIRLEQRDGGTYAEMEMIALSRGIPWALRWLVQPLAERLPRSLLAAMLRDTRDAVSGELTAASLKTEGLAPSADRR